jgi:hypothetical protein
MRRIALLDCFGRLAAVIKLFFMYRKLRANLHE